MVQPCLNACRFSGYVGWLHGRGMGMDGTYCGDFGAFLSGSATFSNMMFSSLQYSVADNVGMNHTLVLALQGIGANAGNMMCVMNVVAAATVVGMAGRESEIIRKTMPVAIGYALLAGTIATLWGGF